MQLKQALGLGSMVVLMASIVAPSAFAFTGTLTCYNPASCAGGTLNLNGPGTSASALYFLQTTATTGTMFHYYVCEVGVSPCLSNAGSNLAGWSWTFTASGTTSAGGGCLGNSCEGNGFGTPNTLTLTITASPTVSTNSVDLEIYACSGTITSPLCANAFQLVASATITANVPQFALGMGIMVAATSVGLLLVRRNGKIVPN